MEIIIACEMHTMTRIRPAAFMARRRNLRAAVPTDKSLHGLSHGAASVHGMPNHARLGARLRPLPLATLAEWVRCSGRPRFEPQGPHSESHPPTAGGGAADSACDPPAPQTTLPDARPSRSESVHDTAASASVVASPRTHARIRIRKGHARVIVMPASIEFSIKLFV
jgi:hypothetical protein